MGANIMGELSFISLRGKKGFLNVKRKWFHPVGGGVWDDFVEAEEHVYTLKNS